jgi:hypothetical protein
MTNIKYKEDIPKMNRLKLGAIKVLEDPETGTLYYDICGECGMLLSEDDMGFGHDCE